jgi:hypothetical protein
VAGLPAPGGSSGDTAEIAALEARIREIDIRRKTVVIERLLMMG